MNGIDRAHNLRVYVYKEKLKEKIRIDENCLAATTDATPQHIHNLLYKKNKYICGIIKT